MSQEAKHIQKLVERKLELEQALANVERELDDATTTAMGNEIEHVVRHPLPNRITLGDE